MLRYSLNLVWGILGLLKIPSVIAEVALGNCAMKIHDLVDEYKKTTTGRKKIMPLLKKCYPGRYDNMDVDEFIELHNNSKLEDVYCFKVGCFSKYTPEKIQELMDYLGVSMQSDVYMPETDMTDLEELKSVLTPEEYQEAVSKMEGKFKKVEKPLMAGYVTIEQLYHIPSYSNKVTSDLVTNGKKSEPITGRGRYRDTGQKILTSLLITLIAEIILRVISKINSQRLYMIIKDIVCLYKKLYRVNVVKWKPTHYSHEMLRNLFIHIGKVVKENKTNDSLIILWPLVLWLWMIRDMLKEVQHSRLPFEI